MKPNTKSRIKPKTKPNGGTENDTELLDPFETAHTLLGTNYYQVGVKSGLLLGSTLYIFSRAASLSRGSGQNIKPTKRYIERYI